MSDTYAGHKKEDAMKKMITLFTVLVLTGTLGVSGSAYAQTPTDLSEEEVRIIEKKREMRKKFKEEMEEKLGLSDAQQQKLQEHRNSHRDQAKQRFASIKELRNGLQTELEKEEFDVGKIRSIHEQLKSIKNEMADHRLEGILEVREILTAEQFKKFHELKGDRKGKWGGKHKGSHGEFGMHHKGATKE